MSSSSECVFILGGTGNIGTRLVQDLLDNNVAVTLYARRPSKVESLFPVNEGLVNVVQGEYSHTRLCLLVTEVVNVVKLKNQISRIAFEAGVKQIVDISSTTVNIGWRTSYIGASQFGAEMSMFDLPNRGHIVNLRPGSFMSNFLYSDHPLPGGKIYDTSDSDRPQGYISTNDIGAVAAVILRDNISKHGDAVYSLTGDVRTPAERAEILTRILGQEITYQKIKPIEKYNNIIKYSHFPHLLALDLCCGSDSQDDSRVTPEISILLGREPETLEEYLASKKAVYLH